MAKKSKKKAPPKQPRPVASRQSRPVLEHRLDMATYYSLLAIVIAVPLAFGQFTYDPFDMPKVVVLRAITLFAAGAWAARFLLGRRADIRRTPLDWLVLAFIAWVALSTVFSVSLPTSILGKYRRYEGFISFANYAVVFFLAAQTLRDRERVHTLARTMVAVGAAVGLYGICQYFGLDFLNWARPALNKYRAFSTYGNPDLLVGYLVFLVPIGIGVFATAKDKTRSRIYAACTFVIFMAMMLTFSRSAWPAILVALIYLGVLAWRQKIVEPKQIAAGAAVLVVLVGAFTIYSLRSSSPTTNVYERAKILATPTKGTAGARLEMWKTSIAATKDRPITGFGPDTFRLLFPFYKTVRYVQLSGYASFVDNAHSYPFQLAPTIGIPGALLFYAVLVLALVSSTRWAWRREKERNAPERFFAASLAAGVLAYSVHQLFSLSVTGTTVLMWIALAALMLPLSRASEIEWKPGSAVLRAVAASALAIALLAGLYLNFRYMAADVAFLRSQRAGARNADEAMASVDEALALDPYIDAYRIEKANLLLGKAMAGRDKQGVFGAIEYLKESVALAPREYTNYEMLARAYVAAAQLGDKRYETEALDTLLYALRYIHPHAPSAMVHVAAAYLAERAPRKALPYAKEALLEDPHYAEAAYQLGVVYEALGRKALALRVYERAVVLRKKDVNAKSKDFPAAEEAIKRLTGK